LTDLSFYFPQCVIWVEIIDGSTKKGLYGYYKSQRYVKSVDLTGAADADPISFARLLVSLAQYEGMTNM
jgi:hypothetical protein